MIYRFFIVFCLTFTILFADKLQEVKENGVLVAGVKYDFKPFGYIEDQQLVGFDIDLVKYIANYLDVEVKFEQVSSKNRLKKLANGEVDLVAASMTHKRNRESDVDFTISYFFDGQTFLVRKNSKFKTKLAFLGKKVGYIDGSSSGETLKSIIPKVRLVKLKSYDEGLRVLKKGLIDAITTDLVWCKTAEKDSDGKLKVSGDVISVEPYGMGVPENESNFRDEINSAIQQSVKDGTYEKLYIKWFDEKPKKLPELWPS